MVKSFMKRGRTISARIEWFGDEVAKDISITMQARVKLASQLLRDAVVKNISDPVRKFKGPRSGRLQVDPASRSKPGEFPKADTTRLRKDIFWEVDGLEGRVATTLDYGLILETKMNRSFLVRTQREKRNMLAAILLKGRGSGTEFRLDRE